MEYYNACLFCGGNASEPGHRARCDGRQGGTDRDPLPPDYHAPFARGRDTSEAAAESISPQAGTLCAIILEAIKRRSATTGLTCAEAEAQFQLRHQTASARLWDLHTRGFIRDAGIRRVTSSGRQAIAWVAVER